MFQYLYGEDGNDTYVYGTASGRVYIGSQGETADTGTADRVIFTDLNPQDIHVEFQDYRTSYPTEGLALMIMWADGLESGQLQIANEAANIETFEFADGSSYAPSDLLLL